MSQNRRQFLSAAGMTLSYGMITRLAGQAIKGTKIILLGTKGGPAISASGRSNPSILILINNTPYLIDCGYGTSRQLLAAGVRLNRLRYVFITHHHSDHNIEYGTVFYNALTQGFATRIDAYGPIGLEKMTRDFFSYMELDIDVRIKDEGWPDPHNLISAHDIRSPGLVLQNEEVKVTTALVRHPMVKQAFAYRFDAKDRSIVLSGDTTYAPELAEFAKGADVLIHEVIYLPAIDTILRSRPDVSRLRRHLIDSHTTSEDVGKIAAKAGVKTLVLSHLVPGDVPSITDEQWSEGARKYFSGQIIVGKDLMEI